MPSMTADERQAYLDKYLQEQRDRLREYQESLGLVEKVAALTEPSFTDAVDAKVRAEGMTYGEAARVVSRERPELYERYRLSASQG
jgi:hypothetical protein